MSSIKHVAIIMDGNGRWAKKRFRPRIWGHVRGSSVIPDIVRASDEIGLNALTLYAFSTENWSRPHEEVSILFKLLKKFLFKERSHILSNNIKFQVMGELEHLPSEVVHHIRLLEELTVNATGLILTFAFNYGGRSEILRAVNSHFLTHPERPMTEIDMEKYLYRPQAGNVDLMIRTGGEQRISNFMLWQMAYAELYFTPTRWPDFTVSEFKKIIAHVSCRERRFGNICEKTASESYEKAQANKSVFAQEAGLNV